MKFASRSAMLSLSSAKAGSRAARGNSGCVVLAPLPLGVVCEARRLVREGGRRGVVGRDGRLAERARECCVDASRWMGLGSVRLVSLRLSPFPIQCGGVWCNCLIEMKRVVGSTRSVGRAVPPKIGPALGHRSHGIACAAIATQGTLRKAAVMSASASIRSAS